MTETTDFDADDLFFGSMLQCAAMLSLLSFIDDQCEHTGYRDPQGLTVFERFKRARTANLEDMFLSLEDGNPRLAARLYKLWQEAKEIAGHG